MLKTKEFGAAGPDQLRTKAAVNDMPMEDLLVRTKVAESSLSCVGMLVRTTDAYQRLSGPEQTRPSMLEACFRSAECWWISKALLGGWRLGNQLNTPKCGITGVCGVRSVKPFPLLSSFIIATRSLMIVDIAFTVVVSDPMEAARCSWLYYFPSGLNRDLMLVTCLDTVNVMNGMQNIGVNIVIVIQTSKKSTESIEGIGETSSDGAKPNREEDSNPQIEVLASHFKLGCKSQKNWDYRLFPKEYMEALWLQKQDAAAKRECMKKY
ncbi:hypothetical protein RHSIM_Rhsim03G0030200 [Rhododendron simsii]|uniref:Uncharacterized protein n=1 Tax=Rhododendron simsii TaxID=118357 RepID=A0A834H9G2_RHOSS|nr:hypothetical protein RHSIM_Rhsim03G0030200 [Rhododendron simsii]